VENGEGDGGLANSPGPNESNGRVVFCETNDLLDPFVTSKEDSWWWWWGFSVYTRYKYQMPDSSTIKIANLVRA
jgi:hypothetical protein